MLLTGIYRFDLTAITLLGATVFIHMTIAQRAFPCGAVRSDYLRHLRDRTITRGWDLGLRSLHRFGCGLGGCT